MSPVASRARALRPVIGLFSLFVFLQASSAAVLFALKLGLTPASVELFYLGDRPRSLGGLLEVAVPHLLAVPLTVFIVAHVVTWAGVGRGPALVLLTRLSFATALIGVGAGFAVRFLWPALSMLKLAAFLGLEGLLFVWVAMLARASRLGLPSPRPSPPRGEGGT